MQCIRFDEQYLFNIIVPFGGSPALLSVQQGKYELTSHIHPWLNVSAQKMQISNKIFIN